MITPLPKYFANSKTGFGTNELCRNMIGKKVPIRLVTWVLAWRLIASVAEGGKVLAR